MNLMLKATRTAAGYLRRFACFGCSTKTTRKHSVQLFPCCESCEDRMDARAAYAVLAPRPTSH